MCAPTGLARVRAAGLFDPLDPSATGSGDAPPTNPGANPGEKPDFSPASKPLVNPSAKPVMGAFF
jgi:hypothetical protein